MDAQTHHSNNTPVNHGHSRKTDTTTPSPRTPLPMPPPSSHYNPDSGRGHSGKKGACFLCKEEGHWARECPNSRSRSSSSSKNAPRLRSKCYPEKRCKCGLTCVVRTSKTSKNPNRDFYCCPKSGDEKCECFMGWCDVAINSGQADPSDQYPICDCRAGKGRLMTVQDGELAGCQYFVCMLKEGHGRCNFFEWYTGPPLNFEQKNDCEGENKRPQCNMHVEGPKSPPIIDWGNSEERTRFRSDEMVAPVVIAARREQGAESVGSGLSPLNWQTADQDATSDETLVPASPPLSIRRKLDFDEAISGFTPNVCRASPVSDSAAFEPSPSFKDGFVETVAPAPLPLPPREPREFRHSVHGLGSSKIDMPSPHESVDID